MKLDKLQYQIDAVEFATMPINSSNITFDNNTFANPILVNTKNIDVKMETGTGKTYVYTRLMHELKREFGFFKFIILVPSVAIKEGTKMSLQSSIWNTHFRQEFANQNINLGIINSGDFESKKGKRKQFPESLRTFCEASRNEEKTIQVLLLNDAMLSSKSMTSNDYDGTLFGSTSSPIKGLENTRPIIIIDEPHRFNKENKAWKNINEGLKPQLIFRFGATFPDIITKVGGIKKKSKDYENLVFDLNAIRAFNEGLVKSVHIEYPAIPGSKDDIITYKVKSIDKSNNSVIFSDEKKSKEIKIGESLSILHEGFSGITLEQIQNSKLATLSNEMELYVGSKLLPNVFGTDYQEIMMNQALNAHFLKEKENFDRIGINNNPARIKTNTLFFIDSVKSFRDKDNIEEKGWLRLKFEQLLKIKLESELNEAKKNKKHDYKSFLEASLKDISANIAGYFAEDNLKKGEEAIQNEVDDILRNKEKMLKFKNDDGTWFLRRFLFSKWALREGWDNPNVFVIAKLRSSGSENSKIQEVGRGLRLPFDENGVRLSQDGPEDFRLTYIVGFDEQQFAKDLIGDINDNSSILYEGKITEKILNELISKKSRFDKESLISSCIINESGKISDHAKFIEILPEKISASKDILELLKVNYGGGGSVKKKLLNDDIIDDNDIIIDKLKFTSIISEFIEITDENIEKIIPSKFAQNKETAKAKLLSEGIIDSNDIILDSQRLEVLCPINSSRGLKTGRVTSQNSLNRETVKLRKLNFEKLRSLWDSVTKRYALHFQSIDELELEKILTEILSSKEKRVFVLPKSEIKNEFIIIKNNQALVEEELGEYQETNNNFIVLNYGEFLKRLNKRTHLPLNLINKCIIAYSQGIKIPKEYFNVISIENIVNEFEKVFTRIYSQRFSYSALEFIAETSIFKDVNGKLELIDEIKQGLLGNHIATDIPRAIDDNYLYDKYVYDSEIEHDVLKVRPSQKVVVYGKLPKSSIKIPTYTGGTTTPDFVYAIKRENKPITIHLIVETKSDNLRESDEIAIKSQKEAFKNILNVEWRKSTTVQEFSKDLNELTGE